MICGLSQKSSKSFKRGCLVRVVKEVTGLFIVEGGLFIVESTLSLSRRGATSSLFTSVAEDLNSGLP